MYLKRMEAIGFKSFADKINVEFLEGINGVVGPNGCGKSNITDGIRWVLGEQSARALRGTSMSDVIFAGSDDRSGQNYAAVTLVFDNQDRHLKIDYNEVEITRRLFKSGESEYLLNKQTCRLKDLIDLIADSGLSKESLSMISQGQISNFASAKPEDRRLIFEDAAQVSKYKKKKQESLKKLERTDTNLIRVNDILNEIETQYASLERQAKKAETFLKLNDQLKEYEVNVLVDNISKENEKLEQANKQINQNNQEEVALNTQIIAIENTIDQKNEYMTALDQEIESLQKQTITNLEQISQLEQKKVEYELSQNNNQVDEMQAKIDQLNNKITTDQVMLKNHQANLKDSQSKQADYQSYFNETDLDLKNKQKQIQDIQQKSYRLKQRLEQTSGLIESKNYLFDGVKVILENKKALSGIEGMVSELIKMIPDHSLAISTALGNSMQHIVCATQNDALKAIHFLKRNEAGKATFLPIDTISPKGVEEDLLFILNSHASFIGIASKLVTNNPKYQNIIDNLLGNIVVCNNINEATDLSNLINHRLKIVTLDGDMINIGGSLTGGKVVRNKNNLISLNNLSDALVVEINELSDQEDQLNTQIEQLKKDSGLLVAQINQEKVNIGILTQNISQVESSLNRNMSDLALISDDISKVSSQSQLSAILDALMVAINLKNDLNSEIKVKRELRYQTKSEIDQARLDLTGYNRQLKQIQTNKVSYAINKNQIENNLKQSLERLSKQYQMTYEYALNNFDDTLDINQAKETCLELNNQINALGNVNVDALEQFKEIDERYQFLTLQKDDLLAAKSLILDTINDMDKIMIVQFKATIEKINAELPITFKKLFGGGYASLSYTDPDNLLETGIEINAHPPGKSLQNINLFSGGEKALIALSVLFAILKVQTMPVCILDEVEAALDPANVVRFAKYLKEFAQETQFIVITHRPGTMEQCDTLYGVTMQEKGVSKILSVHLQAAKDLVES